MGAKILTGLGSAAFLEFLKKIAKGAGGYAGDGLKMMGDNFWVLAGASTCTTLFLLIMNMLNSWYGFPLILNLAVHGIYHLGNMAWVISNGKGSTTSTSAGNNPGPSVNTGN